ncbi:MAG: thiamine phosphate synthase [Kiloniellales bacterium]|nr:thiamine phosphate synthase [Kiloniellales bacterium]
MSFSSAIGTMAKAFDLTLYLVIGPDDVPGREVEAVTAAAVAGGVTLVQLRDKTAPDAELAALARRLQAVLAPRGLPLIVNDRIEVAREVGAAGVHLGVDDRPAAEARAALGPEAIVGVSAGTFEEADLVDPAVVDYVGSGAVYATATKADAGAAIGLEGLDALRGRLALPMVAIGGIGLATAEAVAATGVEGIAVVSAICGAADPEAAARDLRAAVERGRRGGRREEGSA